MAEDGDRDPFSDPHVRSHGHEEEDPDADDNEATTKMTMKVLFRPRHVDA